MRAELAWQRGSDGKLHSARSSPFKGEAGRGMGREDLPPLSTRVESLMERRDLRHGFFMLEGLICFVAAVRPATLVRGIKIFVQRIVRTRAKGYSWLLDSATSCFRSVIKKPVNTMGFEFAPCCGAIRTGPGGTVQERK